MVGTRFDNPESQRIGAIHISGMLINRELALKTPSIYPGWDEASGTWTLDVGDAFTRYFRENKGATDWGSLERETKLYNNYKLDYEEFGENIYKMGLHYNIPIYNLGKGKPYNMITPISEKYE